MKTQAGANLRLSSLSLTLNIFLPGINLFLLFDVLYLPCGTLPG